MIELVHVSKTYGQRKVVDDVSLEVHEGHLLALLGGSGSGKTTTLKMINRLVEADRDGGIIRVGGEDVSKKDAVQLRRTIGYVIQGSALFPHKTVAENIAVVPRLLGWPKEEIARRIDELLLLVGLPPEEYRDRFPDQLSGGQKQRVGFARALAAEPRIILLDEPFGALDPEIREELQKEFLGILGRWKEEKHAGKRKYELTAVMVTHDMTEALLMADRIAVMRDGRLLQHGTPGELLTSPSHDFVKALMDTPRRQAEQVQARIAGRGRQGAGA